MDRLLIFKYCIKSILVMLRFLRLQGNESDDDSEDDVSMEEDDDGEDGLVNIDGDYVEGMELAEGEEDIVRRFLQGASGDDDDGGRGESLADIILNKIREKEAGAAGDAREEGQLSPKVVEVYTAVGKMLAHYKSGKLPKALKMLPHLKNWEDVLWLTRPDTWSPSAIFACTRIFSSNLNVKMAQRFYNLVLLESCRDDIAENKKLNYHLYMALKKALFKPAAFYKGILLPLCASRTCTLREATIFGSVIAKVSVPPIHSAAALMKLTQMPYSGSTSMLIRILLSKKYALPRRVIGALVDHFYSFVNEKRELPVVWHQALLVFAQRYKLELDDTQRNTLRDLLRVQNHHLITAEVRRELFGRESAVNGAAAGSAADGAYMSLVEDRIPVQASASATTPSGGMMLLA